MSLELYMQPFFASGHFYDYKEYVAPRTDVTATYGKDRGTIAATRDTTGMIAFYTIDPDGTGPAAADHRSATRTSASSRCAGTRCSDGSIGQGQCCTSHGRSLGSRTRRSAISQFDRDRSALIAARPDNIFLVKATWWLPR